MLIEKHQAQGSGVSIFTSYSLAKFPIFQDQEQEKHTTFESDQRCTKHPRNGRFHCPNLIQHRPCIFKYLGGIMNTELWGLRSQTELIECGSPMAFTSAFILICSVLQAELLSDWPRPQQLQHLSEHGVHHIQVSLPTVTCSAEQEAVGPWNTLAECPKCRKLGEAETST